MAEEEQKAAEGKAKVLVAEEEKPKKKFNFKLVFTYFLLLAGGLFIGIVITYLVKNL